MTKLNKCSQVIVLLLVLTSPLNTYCQKVDWNVVLSKIKLFSTPKQDIEKLLKYSELKEKNSSGVQTVYYNFDKGWISVDYSSGKCAEHHSPLGYNVEKNIAVGM